MECGACGSKFKGRTWNKGEKGETKVWQCATSMKYGIEKLNKMGEKVGCNTKSIHETILQQAFVFILRDVIKNKNEIIESLEKEIFKVIEETQNDKHIKELSSQIEKISRRKDKLIDLYSEEAISKIEFKQRNDEYNLQLEKLEEYLKQSVIQKEQLVDKREITRKIKNTISKLSNSEDFSEEVCKELLNKVIVYDRNHFKVILNGNIEKEVYFDKEENTVLSETQYLLCYRKVHNCSKVLSQKILVSDKIY
ncbi:MAG: recombinase zinc beta ribbon domain-containing protein [Deltaproteobacteria bacterium]